MLPVSLVCSFWIASLGFFCICSVSCVLCFLCLWILYSSFFVVFLMCLVPNVVFVSGLFTLDSFFGIFLSSFVVLCQIFPVYLDCSLVIASLEGFLSSFCVLCPKLPLSLDYSLLMTSSGFILSSFCALCLVLLVSLDCLIGYFYRRSVPCVQCCWCLWIA